MKYMSEIDIKQQCWLQPLKDRDGSKHGTKSCRMVKGGDVILYYQYIFNLRAEKCFKLGDIDGALSQLKTCETLKSFLMLER